MLYKKFKLIALIFCITISFPLLSMLRTVAGIGMAGGAALGASSVIGYITTKLTHAECVQIQLQLQKLNVACTFEELSQKLSSPERRIKLKELLHFYQEWGQKHGLLPPSEQELYTLTPKQFLQRFAKLSSHFQRMLFKQRIKFLVGKGMLIGSLFLATKYR